VIRLYLARGWRTDLPRLVLLSQAGNAVSFFGYELILPFEIICLHQIRGFATATAGLVLAAILGTATLMTPAREPYSITHPAAVCKRIHASDPVRSGSSSSSTCPSS
jgi:hypothetical protein